MAALTDAVQGAVIEAPALHDPEVAAFPEVARLVVDLCWVLLAEAEDVGLAHEAFA
jgi:hypothetical protein